MNGARPYVPRLVALLPPGAAGAPVEWARSMRDAGVDGLALQGDPADPVARDLLAALRGAVPLPLELHFPPTPLPEQDWAAPLAATGIDWVVPGRALPKAMADHLEALGVGVAWPPAAAPLDAARVHAAPDADAAAPFAEAPEAAERSLTLPRSGDPVVPGGGIPADTLVVPGEALAETDPGAAVARWRGRPA
ncbi:hypothetical protein AN478_01880 [Thiohalorhabdus denitrificans]|uniref:Uncharacterized protein n=1 Tax=Thiohalorhabdus denitrificans TaxID=381306 RepID=A0A0P9C818_9GAMM|nr:hypothetical protein [Thiohalorhabdus denitrificans]KPV41360.1 hypothetical protein AN478_01880 [Thiohalorhabdus denitrificans]SCY24388.1 hypothetical protein SAMN05661077_1566 [Thiohalorhabdus denitrificans]